MQKYSHDSTLGKGEVLHQDVKTSVLIIEELPDPPVTHGKREGLAGHQIKNTPLFFRTECYPLMEKNRDKQRERKKMQIGSIAATFCSSINLVYNNSGLVIRCNDS